MLTDLTRVVVIGGGVAGCSIAYHLAVAGGPDVLVVDRGDRASLAATLADGARKRGVAIRTDVNMRNVTVDGRRVTGVETDEGTVRCEVPTGQKIKGGG